MKSEKQRQKDKEFRLKNKDKIKAMDLNEKQTPIFLDGYEKGVNEERNRILKLIKNWESTDFGSDENRYFGMQELKDVILQGDEKNE